MRDELLNGEEFNSVLEARVVITTCIAEYHTRRPHSGLGMPTPSQFSRPVESGRQMTLPSLKLDQSLSPPLVKIGTPTSSLLAGLSEGVDQVPGARQPLPATQLLFLASIR